MISLIFDEAGLDATENGMVLFKELISLECLLFRFGFE